MTYTKNDLPEAQVKALIGNELLAGYTLQLMAYKEPTVATERVMLIKVDGSSATSTVDHQFPSMFIALFGAVSDADISGLRLRAEEIAKQLRGQSTLNRSVGVQNLTNPFGPYFTDSGRPVFEINFTLVLSEE